MSIDISNINTKGAVVTIGGVPVLATNPDADGYYWGTVSGVDAGCTSGGVKVKYNYEKKDIFCDQSLAAVESSIIGESAEVSFNMLESDVTHLKLAIQQCVETLTPGTSDKLAVGGITAITYVPLKLEVADNDTGKLTTWTFHKVLSNGIEINFDRDKVTEVVVTFTAYAETAYAVGHQLFSVHEDLTV